MSATAFRVAAYNVLAQRFSGTWNSRRATVAKRLGRVLDNEQQAKASVYMLTECYHSETEYLTDQLNCQAVRHLGSTVAFASSWKLGRVWKLTWLGDTHGAIIAELKRDGVTINAVASHLPPFAWRAKYRRQCLARLAGFMAGWTDPTVIGGDFNWRGMEATAAKLGLASARIGDELTTNGTLRKGRAIDYVLTRRMGVRRFNVLPGWGSDHHMLSVSLTAPGGDL